MKPSTVSEFNVIQLFGLVVATTLIVAGVSVSIPGVEPQIQLVLSIFLATVALWMAKPVPYEISSLLCVILLFGLGLTETFTDAVVGFASTLVFFFLLLLLIGKSIAKVDLDQWVANRLVSTTSTPRSSVHRLSSAILLLAFVMPSGLARTVTFMPVIDQINDLYRLDGDSQFRRLSYYMIGHLNPIASVAVMTGGGMAVVTAEMINALVRPITWIEWVVYMAPPAIVLFAFTGLVGSRIYQVGDTKTIEPAPRPGNPSSHADEVESLNRDQAVVIVTLFFAILAWIIGSFVGVPAIIPAMGVVFIFALPGVKIITPAEFTDLSWGIVFLLGTMLSILEVMEAVDAFDFIIAVTLSGFDVHELGILMLLVLLLFSVLVRATFSSSAAAIAILLPIVLEFTGILGYEPLFISFSLMLVLISATFMPINLATVLVAYEAGPLSLREVFMLGCLTLLMSLLVIIVSWIIYWPFIDDLLVGVF